MAYNAHKLHYFNLFFEDIPFYKALKKQKVIKEGQFGYDIIHPYCKPIHVEMDKWLHVAFKHDYAKRYQRRLGAFRKNNIKLQSVLNELMSAYFLEKYLKMRYKEYEPPAVKDNFGEWIFTKNKKDVFIEVKSPWEKRTTGTRHYSQYDKLMKDIKKAYKQRPKRKMPFLLIIIDELQLHLTQYNHELLDALYGKRALCFAGPDKGTLKYIGYGVVDKRSIFQRNIHRILSGVAVLRFVVTPNIKFEIGNVGYSFSIYHNPFCHRECKLNTNWFRPYKQYLSHNKMIK